MYELITYFHEFCNYQSMIFFDNFFCSLFYYIDRFLFWLWSNFGKVNANVTVYANKNKDTLQPLFRENNRRFVAKDFVKTCDELVIGQGLLSGSWRLWWVQVDGGLGFSWTSGSNIKQGLDTRYVIYLLCYIKLNAVILLGQQYILNTILG